MNPAQPNPAQPNPAQPNPAQPNPVQPNPVQPNPVQPNPVQPPAGGPNAPRDDWGELAPALPSEPTHPNLRPPEQPLSPYEVAWPARNQPPDREPERRSWWSAGRFRGIVLFTLSVLETLLVIRFFLKLFGANPDAPFSIFNYGLTELFVAPFEGVFTSPGTHGAVLDLATLLAMIVYALIAWLTLGALATLASRRPARSA